VALILIVEDEPLVAMMLEEWLRELGHQPVGPADTLEKALKIANSESLAAAILDVNLRGARSDAAAEVLRVRGIPFAFATGDAADAIGEAFTGLPTIKKPYDFETVRETLSKLLNGMDDRISRGFIEAQKP
jgi:CheY-like chemotaxis protein